MTDTLFPGTAFAWAFYLLAVTVTLIASYTDVRRMVVPKWLTIPALFLGIALNVVRFGLQEDHTALEGLWFSLKGFGLGFGVFFVLFVLGTCRGGDVKLFAALGAWLGLTLSIFVLIGTIVLILLFTVVRYSYRLLFGPPAPVVNRPNTGRDSAGPLGKKEYEDQKRLRRRMIYSPALAIATAVLLLWFYRVGLGLHLPVKQQSVERPAAAEKV